MSNVKGRSLIFVIIVDELEKHVTERKEQMEQLIQTVLREAFEGK